MLAYEKKGPEIKRRQRGKPPNKPPNTFSNSPHQEQVVVVKQLPTDAPGVIWCPHCRKDVLTEVECWPCCWIPFCVNDYKDVEHTCPDCHQLLHFHKRR
ncbi:lipopolysaccharide-induced tumor necrosis factor-alpha factor homolog [Halichoeres trimaculatus]|uniref:lipopolysaccharide-induced tumor necrosis factor-alpha factor homolog n=1 Tax=Halichoeres trimaculatus TaxID=147232 RepID=UPI003D9DE31C